jgi:hypothetical protein
MGAIKDSPSGDDEDIFDTNFISHKLEQIKGDYYKCEASGQYIHQSLIVAKMILSLNL